MENVFITGADRGVGFALCEEFAAHGFRVLAGQYMPEWGALAELAEKYPAQFTRMSILSTSSEAVLTASCTEGYTFRVYHPGWVRSYMSGKKAYRGHYEPEESAAVAFRQFTQERSFEDALVMTDIKGEVWPF